jgi:F0F1-type ATP synthase membrane subunit c/vacuolar-type H+-ATPase subunit K
MNSVSRGPAQDPFRRIALVCGAQALGLLAVNGALAVLHVSGHLSPAHLNAQVPLILFAAGTALLVAAPAAQGAIFKRLGAEGFSDSTDWITAYSTAILVSFALREAAGLIGFVLAVLTGNPWWSWGLGGAALLAMALGRPKREHLGV